MSAPTFALIMGIAFTGAGLLGFIPSLVLDGRLLGLFHVNAFHNVVHLAVGLAGFAAWAGMLGAVAYARGLALFYGALAVMGVIPAANTLFGVVPLHGHNVWLHAVTAAAAAYIGFRSTVRHEVSRAHTRERRDGSADRRVEPRPVAYERRNGAFDRRIAVPAGF